MELRFFFCLCDPDRLVFFALHSGVHAHSWQDFHPQLVDAFVGAVCLSYGLGSFVQRLCPFCASAALGLEVFGGCFCACAELFQLPRLAHVLGFCLFRSGLCA